MGVGGHERDRRGLDVDVDAVHDRTQFVVGRGEDRLVDTVDGTSTSNVSSFLSSASAGSAG